jgi:hypothetical protein
MRPPLTGGGHCPAFNLPEHRAETLDNIRKTGI